jgi:hypothetical protein
MLFLRKVRRLLRRRRLKRRSIFARRDAGLRQRTQAFCDATTLSARTCRVSGLLAYIWTRPTGRAFIVLLLRWIQLLEQDKQLRIRFKVSWQIMLSELDSVRSLRILVSPPATGCYMRPSVDFFSACCLRRVKSPTRRACSLRSFPRKRL